MTRGSSRGQHAPSSTLASTQSGRETPLAHQRAVSRQRRRPQRRQRRRPHPGAHTRRGTSHHLLQRPTPQNILNASAAQGEDEKGKQITRMRAKTMSRFSGKELQTRVDREAAPTMTTGATSDLARKDLEESKTASSISEGQLVAGNEGVTAGETAEDEIVHFMGAPSPQGRPRRPARHHGTGLRHESGAKWGSCTVLLTSPQCPTGARDTPPSGCPRATAAF